MIKKMKNRYSTFIFSFLLFPFLAFASAEIEPELIVHNRILATVNGKNISAIDVMKKMDIYLNEAYPDHEKSTAQRFQFFQANWKQTLSQMVDQQLILADAEKLEIKITDGEVRELLHSRFGPNVMATLDQLGVTFDEAWDMLYAEMAVQRMSWYRVHQKALGYIGPQEIKKAFKAYLLKNPPKEEWKYQVLSIRSTTEKLGSIYAQKAYSLIHNDPIPFEVLVQRLKEDQSTDKSISFNVSDDYVVEGKSLSEAHKTVLCSLAPNTYSQPVHQVSRDKSAVHRIFYLKEHIISPPPAFDSMVDTLHDDLVQKEINQTFPKYISRLHKKFNFDEHYLDHLPSDFQPFVLQ